jgi:hypothetical protein
VERKEEEEEVQGGVSDRELGRPGLRGREKRESVFLKIVRFEGEGYLGEC